MKDQEYQIRFANYLLAHYAKEFELHSFSQMERLEQEERMCALLIVDEAHLQPAEELPVQILCLTESVHAEKERVMYVDKYHGAEEIVDKMHQLLQGHIESAPTVWLMGVYSLAKAEYQLPFLLTLASILGEKKKVLILDLQENSGLRLATKGEEGPNLEDIFIMAQKGNYAKQRLLSSIRHGQQWDYIYPAMDSESMCIMDKTTYQSMLGEIAKSIPIDIILINFGARFHGFFELLGQCKPVFLLQGQGELARRREAEFSEEWEGKDAIAFARMQKVKLTQQFLQISSYERLVEEWKWSEMGDYIRKIVYGVFADG